MINNHLIEIVKSLEFFIVENIRTARRFIKKLDNNKNIDKTTFFLINKHNRFNFQSEILKTLTEKKNIGILSDSGYPCVADPGSKILKFAHEKNKSHSSNWSIFHNFSTISSGLKWSKIFFLWISFN